MFYQRVDLRDQDSKGQTSLGKTTTLFGTEVLKHKFDRLAEKAKNSEDIRLQELEECQAFKWLLSAEDAATLGGLVKGCLRALSSACGGRGRTSSNGPSSSHPSTSQQKKQNQTHTQPVNVMRYFGENASQSRVRRCFTFVHRDMSELAFFSDCRVLQGDCLKSRSFTGVRQSDSMLWRSWRTHNLFQVSLRWHVEPGDTASAADLPHPWKLFCVQSLHDLFLPCCK